MTQTNTEVIAAYRDQKKKMESLADTARNQMQARYTELLTEAATLQVEFKADFNATPALPPTVKSFSVGEAKRPEPTENASLGKKIGGLRRSFNSAVKKGDHARASEIAGQIRALGITFDWSPDTVPVPPAAESESLEDIFKSEEVPA